MALQRFTIKSSNDNSCLNNGPSTGNSDTNRPSLHHYDHFVPVWFRWNDGELILRYLLHTPQWFFSHTTRPMYTVQQKSGGMEAFADRIAMYANTPRNGQLSCFGTAIIFFLDEYASCLSKLHLSLTSGACLSDLTCAWLLSVTGESMRIPLDALSVSREKLAFIVNSISLSLVTLSPISSWVGFEVGLIQTELDRIALLDGVAETDIETSAFGILLQSIRYRYYPIFMIFFVFAVIVSERDFAGMLVAERKARVYQLTDGGDGQSTSYSATPTTENAPRLETPKRTWNMVVPMAMLVFFSLFLLVRTGEVAGQHQSVFDKIENTDANSALLWGAMAATICTLIFYLVQMVANGNLVLPTRHILRTVFLKRGEQQTQVRSLMTLSDSVDSFLVGMSRVFPAIIVLTLAWAAGTMVVALGIDRLFARWIVGSLSPEFLPTFSFLVATMLAGSTGTPDGAMSILFPSFLVPTYQACNGNQRIFYSTIAGILSGVVTGAHASPVSDTSVLGALACRCDLFRHIATQVPYTIVCATISIVLGTLPIGYNIWPNFVSLLLAILAMATFLRLVCKHTVDPNGHYDVFTEFYIKLREGEDSHLSRLRQETIKFHCRVSSRPGEIEKCQYTQRTPPQEEAENPFENGSGSSTCSVGSDNV
jgi:Na+/H+ antiporter NhaC